MDNYVDLEVLKEATVNVLKMTPQKAFLCLPMSACLYAILNDKNGFEPKLQTGNLRYNNHVLFKQDFSVSEVKDEKYREWAGHSWIEIGDLICDISIFRTIYSDECSSPCKPNFIKQFGEGRGVLLATNENLEKCGLFYQAIDTLDDKLATGIIKGANHLFS